MDISHFAYSLTIGYHVDCFQFGIIMNAVCNLSIDLFFLILLGKIANGMAGSCGKLLFY